MEIFPEIFFHKIIVFFKKFSENHEKKLLNSYICYREVIKYG